MESEYAMKEELYNTDFCFPHSELIFNFQKYDYTQKFYAFDCNVGKFCCYANRENILKIIEIAKKYDLENLFLTKSFNKTRLVEFKQKTNADLLKEQHLSDDYPVIFWFMRGYNSHGKNDVNLKDYLEL